MVFLCFSSSPSTPSPKHPPLKTPSPKTPPFPNTPFLKPLSGPGLYPCWHHFIQWVFSAFPLLPLNTSFPNTHTPQILMFVLNFILPLKQFTFIIIHQIFCLYAISLNASHDCICPSYNWRISEDIPQVIFPNFKPYFQL